jgi:Uncharacterized protein conserved in bacteria (DUF2199)
MDAEVHARAGLLRGVVRGTDQLGYVCGRCGARHEGLPFSYGVDAPVYWRDEFADNPASMLSDEQRIIHAEHFFVRARIVIPVLDAATELLACLDLSLRHKTAAWRAVSDGR